MSYYNRLIKLYKLVLIINDGITILHNANNWFYQLLWTIQIHEKKNYHCRYCISFYLLLFSFIIYISGIIGAIIDNQNMSWYLKMSMIDRDNESFVGISNLVYKLCRKFWVNSRIYHYTIFLNETNARETCMYDWFECIYFKCVCYKHKNKSNTSVPFWWTHTGVYH